MRVDVMRMHPVREGVLVNSYDANKGMDAYAFGSGHEWIGRGHEVWRERRKQSVLLEI